MEITIKEYELPKLEIKDYDELLEAVTKDNEKYKNYTVLEETLDDDAKKRAELRKIAKTIDDRRKEIEKAVSLPIKEFKEKCDKLKSMYENSADLIDEQIKKFEAKDKELKKQKIKALFDDNAKELKDVLSFEKIFDEKWLNKGSWKDQTFKFENELMDKLEKINNELKSIEDLKSEYEVELKSEYLEHFDLSKIISKNNELNEKKELLKVTSEKREERVEIEKQMAIDEMLTNEVIEEEIDPIKSYILKITAPFSKQKALRKFLDLNNIKYERVDK